MKLYKVLREKNGKLISPYQGYEYEVNKKLRCNDFDNDIKKDCSRGFYATDIDGLIYTFRNLAGYVVYECEVGGRSVEVDQFKRRYEEIELLRMVPLNEVRQLALEWEPRVGYKLAEALFPVNPLMIRRGPVTDEEKELLVRWTCVVDSVWNSVQASVWASVWDSVWNSVWDSVQASVWGSVGDSVQASVWDSVGNSVKASVWDSVGNSVKASGQASVWAYISSLFPGIRNWKYITHPPGQNPFQPGIDLWKAGLVPSFDGKTWRLHTGKRAKVVYEWEG